MTRIVWTLQKQTLVDLFRCLIFELPSNSVCKKTFDFFVKTEFRGASDATMVAECAEEVNALQLRFFTPREIANLLCFPQHFGQL